MIQAATSGMIGTETRLDAQGNLIQAGRNVPTERFFVGTPDSLREEQQHPCGCDWSSRLQSGV
jgi:hypothetical protein